MNLPRLIDGPARPLSESPNPRHCPKPTPNSKVRPSFGGSSTTTALATCGGGAVVATDDGGAAALASSAIASSGGGGSSPGDASAEDASSMTSAIDFMTP